MKNETNQPKHAKGEWKVIEPKKAKEYVIVNDGEENIYIGKDKEKAKKMCKAVNMHDELIQCVRDLLKYGNEFSFNAEQLLKQVEQK